MFKCGICKNNSQHGEPRTPVVTETREKVYKGLERTAQGSEIVREIGACPGCAEGVRKAKEPDASM